MKNGFFKIILTLIVLSFTRAAICSSFHEKNSPELDELISKSQTGDLIFIRSNSSQSEVIQQVTNSPFSHIGLIYKANSKSVVVYEASSIVTPTPAKDFLKKALPLPFQYNFKKYVLKRVKLSDLDLGLPANQKKLFVSASSFIGKRYDVYFDWDDVKIYCSELVWKIYAKAFYETDFLKGINHDVFKLSEEQRWSKFQDLFDPSSPSYNPTAHKLLIQRFGRDGHPDWNGLIVTPSDLFNSDRVFEVK